MSAEILAAGLFFPEGPGVSGAVIIAVALDQISTRRSRARAIHDLRDGVCVNVT